MKMDKLFNIQLFAEDVQEPGADPKPTENVDKDKKPDRDERSVPKYTDDDVNKLFDKKFAEWQKKKDKEVSEAERLGRMSEAEKANERIRLLEEKLAESDRREAVAAMSKQARAMLQDKGIVVGDELLANLIAEDADTTKASVESFISLFNSAVEKAVKEALKGESPKAGSAPAGMTKEQILAIPNRAERQRLMKEHKDLF